MKKDIFYRLGLRIHLFRKPIILVWLIVMLACAPFLTDVLKPFKTTGFIDINSPSAVTERFLNKKFGYNKKNTFIILYHSRNISNKSSLFMHKIKYSLSGLKDYPIKHEIIYPHDKQQISKDKHTMSVIVIIKSEKLLSGKQLKLLKDSIKTPKHMSITLGGELVFIDKVSKQTEKDLFKADYVATPMAIITLIFVFGTLIAAMLPVLLGGGCAIIILTSLCAIGHYFTLSIFTINIALLLGLCLCLDYCLFYISRFREEINKGLKNGRAIAVTQASAGKAIFFSGLAVFASLSALFWFPVNILFSIAVGGLVAVFFSVLVAMILLPAILSLVDRKINSLSVRFWHPKNYLGSWEWFAKKVVLKPYWYFTSVLVVLLLLGYPLLSVNFGLSDQRIFPPNSHGREFYDTYSEKFDLEELTPIQMVVESKSSILSRRNLSRLYNLVDELKDNKRIDQVSSIVNTNSKISKHQYYTLYHTPKKYMPEEVRQLLAITTTKHVTVVDIISKYKKNSPETKDLIQSLYNLKNKHHFKISLTGVPVSNMEVLESIYKNLPIATLWIMLFTYCILLILLRSIFLPLKAIIMNLLSLAACYGVLVLVFQEGYLSRLLNFEAQGMLDISLIVIIFCALFGFSMDYEVFLLSRIKESYLESRNKLNCIIFGIVKSSRIITSAALIVIVLCVAFLVADVLLVKAFGLGIAIAIFVDAFLIRTLLVPSTMSIFKNWNWYLPKWLKRILPKTRIH